MADGGSHDLLATDSVEKLELATRPTKAQSQVAARVLRTYGPQSYAKVLRRGFRRD
jgi:hypothetical protein